MINLLVELNFSFLGLVESPIKGNKSKNIEEHESVFVCKSDGYLLGFVNIQDLFFAENYNEKITKIL